ncbi:MAG: MoxR family ATPase [Planctomycetes bacterium]|nr:MoxR family ATPase [Planctomycetota bacterium]
MAADPAKRLPETMTALREGLSRRIVGMDGVVEHVLYCLLSNGHGLLVGVPGLAKTMLCASLAQMLDLQFKRIQFTPDLMPGDVTGTETLGDLPEGGRGLRFVPGPIFTHLLLADEINRTPPKTQAALMEAMEERQVTCGGRLRPLDPPFLVLATQNPIEQEGTYELPAAQLDRFLVRIHVGYPPEADEKTIVRRTTAGKPADLPVILTRTDILALQESVVRTPASRDIVSYATKIARATRPGADLPKSLEGLVQWGAGPRAGQALVLAGKARARIQGRIAVEAGDIRAVLPAVLGHRVIPSYLAVAEGVTTDDIARRAMESVTAPDGWVPPVAMRAKRSLLARLRGK